VDNSFSNSSIRWNRNVERFAIYVTGSIPFSTVIQWAIGLEAKPPRETGGWPG
jgi:hypothetical protein